MWWGWFFSKENNMEGIHYMTSKSPDNKSKIPVKNKTLDTTRL
jgi:hypothetical protein